MNDNIVNSLSEFKENDSKNKKSLLERIKESTTEVDIKKLLEIGGKYKKVSNDTMRKWVKTASRRIEELKSYK